MPLPATRELFDRYGAMVYRRCAAILGAGEHARDAVQEVFLRVLERRDQFRGESSPSTWLYAVATLHCLQQLRDRNSRRAKLDQLAAEPRLATAAAPEDQLVLSQLLDGEPDDTRLAVYLYYVDGMTLEEVADAVGLSRKTVSRRVREFLAAARGQLDVKGAVR